MSRLRSRSFSISRVVVGAERLALLPLGDRADVPARCARTTRTHSAASANACSLVSAQCTIVNVAARALTNFPIGVGTRLRVAVELDPLTELLGRHADRERQQPEAELAGDHVAGRAARRHPERRMRLLQRLRVHAARRDLPELARPTRRRPRSRRRRSCAAPLPTCGGSRRGRCRSPRARRGSMTGRCRTRPGRRRRCRAPPPPSAARIGWLYGRGRSRTPWPMRRRSVRSAIAP